MCTILTKEQSLLFEKLVKNLPKIFENNPELFKNSNGVISIKINK